MSTTPTAEDTLKESLARLEAQEATLCAELTKVRAVKQAILKALAGSIPAGVGQHTKAPTGSLKTALLRVLAASKQPLANSDMRAALEKEGYAFSLTPLHVTKTLIRLAKSKQVIQLGSGKQTKYRLASQKR